MCSFQNLEVTGILPAKEGIIASTRYADWSNSYDFLILPDGEVKGRTLSGWQELTQETISLIRAKDDDHAIQLANDSEFGLGAAIFTRDIEKGERIAREELQAGICAVNALVRSDPRLPFGGIKHSGYGRELGAEGIRAFMNVKTVLVD